MKQFLKFAPTPEIGLEEIGQSLSTRFPVYRTSICKNKVIIRKNALATAYVKVEHSKIETCISIDTKMFLWIWLFIGWLFYLIGTKGFVDEIYSALERDLKNKYPSSLNCIPNSYQRAEWKTKTQLLGKLGWGLFAYICIFAGVAGLITPVLLNVIMDNFTNWDSGFTFKIYECRSFILNLLWISIGFVLYKSSECKNVRLSGMFFIIHGIILIINNVLSILHLYPANYNGNIYAYIVTILCNVFLLLAGYSFNRNLRYGVSRYVNIATIILVVTSICHQVALLTFVDYQGLIEQENYEKAQMISLILSICTWPFIYTAYFMFARALSKMQKYPIYIVSKSQT